MPADSASLTPAPPRARKRPTQSRTVQRDDDSSAGAEESPSGSGKSRRLTQNCAECRRLKVRCDRKVPCGGCKKRGVSDLCPENSFGGIKRLLEDRQSLLDRIADLEKTVAGYRPLHLLHSSLGYTEVAQVSNGTVHPDSVPQAGSFHRRPNADPNDVVHPGSSPSEPWVIPESSIDAIPGDGATDPTTTQHPQSTEDSSRPIHTSFAFNANPNSVVTQFQGSPTTSPTTGTLVVFPGKVYRYVGPSAGAQLLREGPRPSVSSRSESVSPTGSPRPQDGGLSFRHQPHHPRPASFAVEDVLQPSPSISSTVFSLPLAHPSPTDSVTRQSTYSSLHRLLPPYNDAVTLVDAYFRRIAWLSSPLPRCDFDVMFQAIYEIDDYTAIPDDAFGDLHELALLFAVLGLGTLVNMELSPLHPKSITYLDAAQHCLVTGRFIMFNTLPALQALLVLNQLITYADIPRRWDLAWQLWGTATRIAQAMGLHKDGATWNLDPRELEQRRMTFWEIFMTDIFMSMNWDRPSAVQLNQFDTRMPSAWTQCSNFPSLRTKLSLLSKEVLDISVKCPAGTYLDVVHVWGKINDFEATISHDLRCRAAMIANVSRYGTTQQALDASPEPESGDVETSLRRHHLVMSTSNALYLLLRPYFVSAMRDNPTDPTKTNYAQAFMTVFERSSMVVAALKSLYILHPLVSIRHWHFWWYGISAAVSLAIMCIVCPSSPLAVIALQDAETVSALLPEIRNSLGREKFRRDVDWVHRLTEKARKVRKSHEASPTPHGPSHGSDSGDTESQLATAGWTTRLIQRLPLSSSNRQLTYRSNEKAVQSMPTFHPISSQSNMRDSSASDPIFNLLHEPIAIQQHHEHTYTQNGRSGADPQNTSLPLSDNLDLVSQYLASAFHGQISMPSEPVQDASDNWLQTLLNVPEDGVSPFNDGVLPEAFMSLPD